jgi:hypothetical protein
MIIFGGQFDDDKLQQFIRALPQSFVFGVGFDDLVIDLHDPVEDEFLPLTRPLPDDEFR